MASKQRVAGSSPAGGAVFRRSLAAFALAVAVFGRIEFAAAAKLPTAGSACARSQRNVHVKISASSVVICQRRGAGYEWVRIIIERTTRPPAATEHPPGPATAVPPATTTTLPPLFVHPSNQPHLATMPVCQAVIARLRPRIRGEIGVTKEVGGQPPIGCELYVDLNRTVPSPPSQPPVWNVLLRQLLEPRPPLHAGDAIFGGAQFALDVPDQPITLGRSGVTAWMRDQMAVIQERDGTVTVVTAIGADVNAVLSILYP